MTLEEIWRTRKTESEDVFKKARATELQLVHDRGLSPYQVEFDLGFAGAETRGSGPGNRRQVPVALNGRKTGVGAAYEPLSKGATHLEGAPK